MSCCALHECPRWHSVGQSRAGAGKRIAAEMPPLSQLTISSWQLQGMGWIITILLPALLLKTIFFSFFPQISCFILLDQSLSHSCTMNVLRRTSNSLPRGCMQQWHSTSVSAVFGSWLYRSHPRTLLNLSREPTAIHCVFNFPAMLVSQRQLPVSLSVFRTRSYRNICSCCWGVTWALCLLGACGANVSETVPHCWVGFSKEWGSMTDQAADKSESSQQEVTFWLCWQDKMGFDDFLFFLIVDRVVF